MYQDRFQALTRDSSLNATIGTQYGEQGPYALAEEVDLPTAAPASNISVRFTDGTRAFGTLASGEAACVIDFDRDGFDDLFIGDSLFRNRGRGQPRFAKAATLKSAVACAAGDFDNDEYTDLFVATSDGGVLYHNVKGQLVEDRNTSFPSATAVAFADLDHDGWLDLVVGRMRFGTKRMELLHRYRCRRFHSQPPSGRRITTTIEISTWSSLRVKIPPSSSPITVTVLSREKTSFPT